ncbi:MAG: aminopeptidase P family protein [Candidatus Aenigmarchaeota archaeon]|nr:aminopeptidase P family protein [Candidatus Aenigmarchaeota archaeon]
MDYRGRVRRLQQLLTVPALISDPLDVYYYTGFRPGADDHPLVVVPRSGRPTIYLPPLTGEIRLPFATVRLGPPTDLPRRLGMDETHLPVGRFRALSKKSTLVPIGATIKKPREVKDEDEIGLMKKAIALDREILGGLRLDGKTEAAVAAEMELAFLERGASRSFETIVSSGPHAGRFIHHQPGSRRIARGDPVIVDFGAAVGGYCSDITRTRIRSGKVLETVLAVQEECIALVKPGVAWKDINAHHQQALKERGFTARHGIGHGIGLFVHESADRLEAGMVVTVEPGIYLPREGCRIEDMVLVTRTGCKVLSKAIPHL